MLMCVWAAIYRNALRTPTFCLTSNLKLAFVGIELHGEFSTHAHSKMIMIFLISMKICPRKSSFHSIPELAFRDLHCQHNINLQQQNFNRFCPTDIQKYKFLYGIGAYYVKYTYSIDQWPNTQIPIYYLIYCYFPSIQTNTTRGFQKDHFKLMDCG